MTGIKYIQFYQTPEGFSDLLMSSDGEYLTGLWFLESKYAKQYAKQYEEKNLPVFVETASWLDIYFQGKEPDFLPAYKLYDVSSFGREVLDIMKDIPYGKTMTYGQIAQIIASKRGIPRMSAQAVGGAVGRNPISIILPCHRVVGSGGTMTGYGGGLMNKAALLSLEWIGEA